MYYHASLIAIFSFLQNMQGAEKGKHCADVRLSSARKISLLIESQRSMWGILSFPSFGMGWVTSALFVLLDDIDNPKSREALKDLFATATLASQRWKRGSYLLQTVQLTAAERGILLPAQVPVSDDGHA